MLNLANTLNQNRIVLYSALRNVGFDLNEVQNFFIIVADHVESSTGRTYESRKSVQSGQLSDLFDERDIASSAANASLTVSRFRQGLFCLNAVVGCLPTNFRPRL